MNNIRTFKQRLGAITKLADAEDYRSAITQLNSLRQDWPGNAYLTVLWASYVQLLETVTNEDSGLEDVKQALQYAVELDKRSPEASIELGYYLDNIEDNPKEAAKAFAEGVTFARESLIEGLIGQAKALLQLNKREQAYRCLLELLELMRFQPTSKKAASRKNGLQEIEEVFRLPTGRVVIGQRGRLQTGEIEELLEQVIASRSA